LFGERLLRLADVPSRPAGSRSTTPVFRGPRLGMTQT
jgi:hypothetical protein